MKGFIRVVEIVLTGILIFLTLAQFSNYPLTEMNWKLHNLNMMGRDILMSLQESGFREWYNESAVDKNLSSVLPRNIRYQVELRNAIKPEIRVGCVLCTSVERGALSEILKDFEINDEKVKFSIKDVTELNFSVFYRVDVLVLMSYKNLTANASMVENFLNMDKGIVEITNLTENTVKNDLMQTKIYGLKWDSSQIDSGIGNDPYDLRFRKNASEKNYQIIKYFYHFPARIELTPEIYQYINPPCGGGTHKRGCFDFRENTGASNCYNISIFSNCENRIYIDENKNGSIDPPLENPYYEGGNVELDGFSFTVKKINYIENYVEIKFNEDYRFKNFTNETVFPADNSTGKSILSQDATYHGTNHNIPAGALNERFNFTENYVGRAAWLSDNQFQTDYKNLAKGVIVWAAGNNMIVTHDIPTERGVTTVYVVTETKDMFQSYEILLTLWYI